MKNRGKIVFGLCLLVFIGFILLVFLREYGFMSGGVVSWDKGSSECGFYDSLVLNDPLGDATSWAPAYVDIKSLKIKQIGKYFQFIWEGNGNLYNLDNQYYFVFFDTDNNLNTGQNWKNKLGAEIKLIVDKNSASLVYFDNVGNIINVAGNIPVIFSENKFYISIDESYFNYGNISLYFESSGATNYVDEGSVVFSSLTKSTNNYNLFIESSNQLIKNPAMINISKKNNEVQLNVYLEDGNYKLLIPANSLVYSSTHQEKDSRIGNLSSIISINANGTAKYINEGYILLNAIYPSCDIITNKPVILATGELYGNISRDSVIGIFPKEYSPFNSDKTFGYLFENYPLAMKMFNLGYNFTSRLYSGYLPFNGAKHLLSFEVSIDPNNSFECYNGNPLSPTPACYMHPDGSPEYISPLHEIGHNFGASDYGSKGMRQLLYQNDKINNAGFGECVASLPVIYFATEFYNNPEKYGFNKSSYEWNYYKNFLASDIFGSSNTLNIFETLIKNHNSAGLFNNTGNFDGVATFCSFFQQYSYNFTNSLNPHGNEVIKRFLSLFGNSELINFRASEVETYFSAAYSSAVGDDLRTKLRFWGFSINDTYYNEIYPVFNSILNSPTIELSSQKMNGMTMEQNITILAVCGNFNMSWCRTVNPSAEGVGPFEYNWGNGRISCQGLSATHTYLVPSNYSVKIRAKNSCGLVSQKENILSLNIFPNAISTCGQLQLINNNLNGSYVLVNNIDCSASNSWNEGLGFEPIGTTSQPFSGKIDGNGYAVKNIYINRQTSALGLFGSTLNSDVKNLGIINISINSLVNVNWVGGLAGLYRGNISKSYSSGIINIPSSSSMIGGLVGNLGGSITNSYSKVVINANNSQIVGGLVGLNSGLIYNSYASGSIFGKSMFGGLVGRQMLSTSFVNNSFSVGYVYSGYYSGMFIGDLLAGIIANYFTNKYTSGTTLCVGRGSLVGCNVMNNTVYFMNKNNPPLKNWDFNNVWQINSSINEGYPYLR
jgi:hypothetical protein